MQSHPSMLSPRDQALCALIPLLLGDECGSVDQGDTNYDPKTGRASVDFSLEQAPRDWFFESSSFIHALTEAINSASETDDDELTSSLDQASVDGATPFQNAEVLLSLIEPSDEPVYVTMIGNVGEGWALRAEAGLGDYRDDDADACGSLTLYLGSPEAIEAAVSEHATTAVEVAWRRLGDVIDLLPEPLKGGAKSAIRERAAALA